ncbi:MAG: hypothetical protein A2015_01105 [Spirochaetes bacterium GWF1_31_7]|nr:MAG: hypothetical protein A2Y30_01005 [Spirochaetes bacterium GWE1_32_154]OHD47897.1 MAG: hypothetical protein A2015_01105 [Spirochaetes bacterium GWF1_31_7]OHD48888.1 MAG: hypothetical protein A2Y29_16820 [Spirochaetes bacterium GWE2_31_10]OHD82977.1 MAG: hypothetical protein A2355_04310 [Spirochaetes bacterium RIFOXYB1_FULL_32_8]HBD96521.1 AP endonuclease [Spirochaetia bacterium]
MYKIGLKLWSTNENYKDHIISLYNEKLFDYIELYVKPDTYLSHGSFWKSLAIPFEIHAPHFGDGVNMSLPEKFDFNHNLYLQAKQFADDLHAHIIIFHPGVGGDINETIRQIKVFNDTRIIIENKPQFGLNGELCVGHTPEEIKKIINETGVRFCLDMGHAICSANSKKINFMSYLHRFLELSPSLYHLTDGEITSEKDRHDHYGEGTYPIKQLLSLIPDGSIITNEAKKESHENLDCFKKDINYFRKLLTES